MNDTNDIEKPATQGDLELLGGNLSFQLEEVRESIEHMREENNQRFEKQNKVLEALLVVTQTLSGQLAEIKGTPQRVENHEERITSLEVQARMSRR